MNKRCIVNVATGEFYLKQQDRLRSSLESQISEFNIIQKSHDPEYISSHSRWSVSNESETSLFLWKDIFPNTERPHDVSPYGFKAHAIRHAFSQGYKTILWTDSPAFSIKKIDPIFERIENYGYYAMSHHDPLENWVGDTALKRFGLTRDQLKGFHLPSGSCYGFDLSKRFVINIFDQFCQYEEEGLFKSEVIGEGKWHRHDEAILALILNRFSLPVFFNDPLFQSDSPECVIRSGANWTQDAKVYGI